MRLKELESRYNSKREFSSILPEREAIVKKEQRISRTLLNAWSAILGSLESFPIHTKADELNKIQGLGIKNMQILFACRSRIIYRVSDAVDQILVTSAAFIKGCQEGYEVAQPPRPYPVLRTMH